MIFLSALFDVMLKKSLDSRVPEEMDKNGEKFIVKKKCFSMKRSCTMRAGEGAATVCVLLFRTFGENNHHRIRDFCLKRALKVTKCLNYFCINTT